MIILLLIPNPLINTNYVVNYVASPGIWTLTETDMYCADNIDTASYKDNLVACQTHCVGVGANRLTFYPTNLCRCCTASSRLNPDITGKVYTHTGKDMY